MGAKTVRGYTVHIHITHKKRFRPLFFYYFRISDFTLFCYLTLQFRKKMQNKLMKSFSLARLSPNLFFHHPNTIRLQQIVTYHEKVIDHYEDSRNVGSLDKNDPLVVNGIIDAKFKMFGCWSTVASSSLATEWIKGHTLKYARLMRVDKPIGSWLLFWPCAWSIALAAPPSCLPSPYFLGLFGVGAFLMRSSGCILNDLWDKDIDARVERTKSRPLASGEVSEKEAFFVLSGLLTASLAILMQFNWLSVLLGSSSVFLVAFYPLAKRYTNWPQFVLGITFNWGALLGFTAVTGTFSYAVCVPLYLACVCWTIIYDTIYAHQDKKDDLLIGLGSTAVQFGDHSKFWLTFFSLGMLSNLFLVGVVSEQLWPYYIVLSASASHLAWQLCTLQTSDPNDCWQKFLANQWLGTAIFCGILLSNLLKKSETTDVSDGNLEELEMDEMERFMRNFSQRNMNVNFYIN